MYVFKSSFLMAFSRSLNNYLQNPLYTPKSPLTFTQYYIKCICRGRFISNKILDITILPCSLISSSKVQRLLKWIEKDTHTHSKIFNFNLCKSQVADPLHAVLLAGAGVIVTTGQDDGIRERGVSLDLAQELPSVVHEVVNVCLGESLGEELSEERGIVLDMERISRKT